MYNLFLVQFVIQVFTEILSLYISAEQPERRYKRISYGDTSKGQPHILRAEETDEYKKWKMKAKD